MAMRATRACRSCGRRCLALGAAALAGGLALRDLAFAATATAPPPLQMAEVLAAAKRLGLEMKEQNTGPSYRLELYNGEEALGHTTGWWQPTGVLHLETIEVRRFTGYWTKGKKGAASPAQDSGDKRYANVAQVARWLGLLLAAGVACWNREQAPTFCAKAKLMAIKDEDKQHSRLVRYYKSLGFRITKSADEVKSNMFDQVFWGGEGTMMEVGAEEFMNKWAPVIRTLGQNPTALRRDPPPKSKAPAAAPDAETQAEESREDERQKSYEADPL